MFPNANSDGSSQHKANNQRRNKTQPPPRNQLGLNGGPNFPSPTDSLCQRFCMMIHDMDLLQTNIDCVIDQFMFNTRLHVLHWKLRCFDFNMSWVHTSPTNSTSRKLWTQWEHFLTPQNKTYNLTAVGSGIPPRHLIHCLKICKLH